MSDKNKDAGPSLRNWGGSQTSSTPPPSGDLQARRESNVPRSNIYAALAAFQAECPPIDFDSEVNAGKMRFKYASLAHIVKTIRPIMEKHGIGFVQVMTPEGLKTRVFHTAAGGDSRYDVVSLFPLPFTDNAQQNGAKLTYYRRYALAAILGIVTEEDTDGPEPEKTVKPLATDDDIKRAVEAIGKGEKNVLELMDAKRRVEVHQWRQLVQAEWENTPPSDV